MITFAQGLSKSTSVFTRVSVVFFTAELFLQIMEVIDSEREFVSKETARGLDDEVARERLMQIFEGNTD